MIFRLWNQTSAYVTVTPEAGLKEGAEKNLQVQRTPAGGGAIYTSGSWREFDLPLRWVPASDAAWINAAWGGDRRLTLEIVEGGASRSYPVMILDQETPVAEQEPGAAGYLRGGLKLSGY